MFISHGACVRRDISSSGAFLFLSLSLFLLRGDEYVFRGGPCFFKSNPTRLGYHAIRINVRGKGEWGKGNRCGWPMMR